MTFVIPPPKTPKLAEDAYYALGAAQGTRWFDGLLRTLATAFGRARKLQEPSENGPSAQCNAPMALSSRGEAR